MTTTSVGVIEKATDLVDRVLATVDQSPRPEGYLDLLDDLAAVTAIVRGAELGDAGHTGDLQPLGSLREPLDRVFGNPSFDRALWAWLGGLADLDAQGEASRGRLLGELRAKGAHLDEPARAELRALESSALLARQAMREMQEACRRGRRPLIDLVAPLRHTASIQLRWDDLVGRADPAAAWIGSARQVVDRIIEPTDPSIRPPVRDGRPQSIPAVVHLVDRATAGALGTRFEWVAPNQVRCQVRRGDRTVTTAASVRFRAAGRPRAEVQSSFTPIDEGRGVVQLWFERRPGLEVDLREALSFVHELGHLLHQTATRSRYANLSGIAGAPAWGRELPSKLVEALLLQLWPDDDEAASLVVERAKSAASDARAGRIELDLRNDPGAPILVTTSLLHVDAATCFSGSNECFSYALGFVYSQDRFDQLAATPDPIDALVADCAGVPFRWRAG